jgi:hypothetical protein
MSHEWDPLNTENGTHLSIFDELVILKTGPTPNTYIL